LYERDEFSKLVSEEIMKITLNFGTVKNGIVDPKVYRTMVRYED
jgi:hypothetical protein